MEYVNDNIICNEIQALSYLWVILLCCLRAPSICFAFSYKEIYGTQNFMFF